MKNSGLSMLFLTLLIVGGINWGLIGFFEFDLVATLFGDMTIISRIIYALVGVSALYAITFYSSLKDSSKDTHNHSNQKIEKTY